MYDTEGPEIMRLYSSKDNSESFTFTDVLDSFYNNVYPIKCSGYAPNTTILCSSVLSSTPSNQNGLFTILMRKDHSHPSSEENTP